MQPQDPYRWEAKGWGQRTWCDQETGWRGVGARPPGGWLLLTSPAGAHQERDSPQCTDSLFPCKHITHHLHGTCPRWLSARTTSPSSPSSSGSSVADLPLPPAELRGRHSTEACRRWRTLPRPGHTAVLLGVTRDRPCSAGRCVRQTDRQTDRWIFTVPGGHALGSS